MRILITEDDLPLSSMLDRGLSEAGYLVDVAISGEDAISAASNIDYDAIILDVGLPDLDGFEVCRRLRAVQQWSPVIMLTARGDTRSRVTGLDSGADDYLAKPFNFAELTARLRALTRRGSPVRSSVLKAGSLELNPATQMSWRGGRQLALSTKEFGLLEVFLRHPGEVLTRPYLLRHVWGTADNASNIVDQFVGYLRRKIDKPFEVVQLETVRGAGYRLAEEERPVLGGPPQAIA